MLKRFPIVAQVMALVTLATLVASGAMIALMLRGPPPRPAPERIEHLADALAGRPMSEHEPGPQAQLPVPHSAATPPTASGDLVRNPAVETALAEQLDRPANAFLAYTADARPPRDGFLFGSYRVAMQAESGGWRVLDSGPDPALSSWQQAILTTIGLVLLVTLALAWLLAARIARPIRRLGQAARQARPGESWAFSPPDGPPEIRTTAMALKDFHRRTLDHAAQRLTMLGAISHDIGTPLARLAFRVERLPDDAREAAMADISTIQRLLADSLTMARGWQGNEEPVDLTAMLTELAASDAVLGREVSYSLADHPMVKGHRLSLERMVQNLLDNALRYGSSARITLKAKDGRAILTVEDNGPGFPDMPAEELLKPYVRGEGSRNSTTGGSGLGLAIVAQVVERHRGSIELGLAPGGGAKVTVRLPLANDP